MSCPLDNVESREIRLPCGTLTLRVEHAEMPLDDLCAFGSRRNPRRGFLIISKVLGKHIPVRPSVMGQVQEHLARQLTDIAGPVLIVALAETAIGLGQGVFEALLRSSGRDDLLFLHSTRYRLSRPLAFSFQESHSHATEHLVYMPKDDEHRRVFHNARTLVLIDDEITTGRTLTHLAASYLKLNPGIADVRFVSITDWLEPGPRADIEASLARPMRCHSLLRGRLQFEPDPAFDPGPLPVVVGRSDAKDAYLATDHGRLGVSQALAPNPRWHEAAGLHGGERVLVLGTGEFVHAPFLFAQDLEQRGWDIHFQSTTRSPVLVGDGIASALEFIDNYHDEMPNYVYNVPDKRYDRILICYEMSPLPAAHRLPDRLDAWALFL